MKVIAIPGVYLGLRDRYKMKRPAVGLWLMREQTSLDDEHEGRCWV